MLGFSQEFHEKQAGGGSGYRDNADKVLLFWHSVGTTYLHFCKITIFVWLSLRLALYICERGLLILLKCAEDCGGRVNSWAKVAVSS